MPTQPSIRLPTYEVCLVLPQMAECWDEILPLLRPLMARVEGATLAGIDLHYRADTDTALFTLKLDGRFLSRTLLSYLAQDAANVGGALLETARLPEEERRRFFLEYLPLYELRVPGLPTLDDALRLLGREFGRRPPRSRTMPYPASGSKKRLEVRFRRGDDWQLGRARTVSPEGIFVATGCPPREGDVIDLELVLETQGVETNAKEPLKALARAAVVQVTPADTAAALGSIGFGARFLLPGPAERQRLDQILCAARDAAPPMPPPRRDARYPIKWPVVIGAKGLRATLPALDVSRRGLFVASDVETPPSTEVEVSFAMDDGGPPVRAAARIARQIPVDVARTRGLPVGFGLELTAFAPDSAGRFEQFVERVSRRARHAVVVGAAPDRVAGLLAELVAAGYVATGATDPPSLVSKAAAARPPDLVLLDGSLDRGDARAARAVRRALAARRVPAIEIENDGPGRARSLADAALLD